MLKLHDFCNRAFQRTVNGAHEGDDLPVQITVRQAMKIAAIMGAVARGHSGYTDALRDASWFLDAVVAESRPDMIVSRSSATLRTAAGASTPTVPRVSTS